MKRFLLFLLLFSPILLCSEPTDDLLQKSLVKIFSTAQEPNFYEPWRIEPQHSMSGSGCIMPGMRILTNAHVVSNAIFIQVLKEGDSKKYVAKVEYVGHDCDLALLKVLDPEFFVGTIPATLGGLPFKRDKVAVYGFPLGGDELSITEGVVSRIEISPYSHSMRQLLSVQTDAAINPGNSGGPVFKDKKMIGVAFQGYNGSVAQNTSYFIPTTIVRRFFDDIKNGTYQGVPAMGIFTEGLENEDLRKYYGLAMGQSGALVTKVLYGSSAWGKLKENDVLLSIDGFSIANDRTVSFRKGERINFLYPLCQRQIGDQVEIKIVRDKKPGTLNLELKADARLVPLPAHDKNPTYFIFDGLVFTPLNWNYPGVSNGTPGEIKLLYFHGLPSESRKEVVLMNHILSHSVNQGYDSKFSDLIVEKVNGHSISGMKDLIAAFDDPQEGRHIIEIDKAKEAGTKIILDAANSKTITAEILQQYRIPSDRSADLVEAGK